MEDKPAEQHRTATDETDRPHRPHRESQAPAPDPKRHPEKDAGNDDDVEDEDRFQATDN